MRYPSVSAAVPAVLLVLAAAFAVHAQGAKKNFVVTLTEGTVRNSQTRVVGEIQEESAVRAIYAMAAGLHQSWKLHEESHTPEYAKLENPLSFRSDAIGYYEAKPGEILRNIQTQMRFSVQRGTVDPGRGFVLKKEKEVWAATAAEAIAEAASKKHRSWAGGADGSDPLFAQVADPGAGSPGETVYRATAVVVYTADM